MAELPDDFKAKFRETAERDKSDRETQAAEAWRTQQAEKLLVEAGFVEQSDGTWVTARGSRRRLIHQEAPAPRERPGARTPTPLRAVPGTGDEAAVGPEVLDEGSL